MSLDQRNLKILNLLQQNGRLSNQELANKVALSPSACLARVKNLEEEGYINGFCANINVEKLGSVLMAFIQVTLGSHLPDDCNKFDMFLLGVDEVIESYVVGSHFDYLLQVAVSDMNELRELSNYLLESELSITKINTIPIIEVSKSFTGYPLTTLATNNAVENGKL